MSAPKTKTKTIRKIAEGAPKKTKHRSILMEMIDEMGNEIAETPVEVAAEPESNPEDEIMAGLLAAIAAKIKEADPDTLKKVMALLDLGTDVVDVAGGSGGGESDSEEPKAESKALQEMQSKFALMEAKTLLLESGREVSDIRIKALANAESRDHKALLESWPKLEEGRSTSHRPATSPPKDDTQNVALYESKFDAAVKRANEALAAR